MRKSEPFSKYAAAVAQEGVSGQGAVLLRNAIVMSNLGLVRQVAHRYKKTCSIPYPDLEQVGCIGLIKAVEGYDESPGNAFSSYAIAKIRGEILHHIRDKTTWFSGVRKITEVKRSVATADQLRDISRVSVLASTDKVIGYSGGGSAITLGETIRDERGSFHEDRDAINDCLGALSSKERSLIIDCFYGDLTLAALAKKYRCRTLGAVANRKYRALQRLRQLGTNY